MVAAAAPDEGTHTQQQAIAAEDAVSALQDTYGVHAAGVTPFLAERFLLAPLRSTRADRMCRVEEMILRRLSCSDF